MSTEPIIWSGTAANLGWQSASAFATERALHDTRICQLLARNLQAITVAPGGANSDWHQGCRRALTL
jgi:hypothetical protein